MLTKKELSQLNRDVKQIVITSALHLLYDSHLYNSKLWPKNDIKVGYGIGTKIIDALWIECNAEGIDNEPIDGRLLINTWNTSEKRSTEQFNEIERILDQSVYENIHFEHELTSLDRFIWFKFTIQN